MTSTATLRYQKQWRLERGRGLYRTVSADTVREHLRDLLRGEASLRGIAEVSGVPTSVVARISSGQQPTVTRRVSSALMKITPHDLTARPNAAGFVPKVGAVRRIRALQAIGHCARDIADATTLTEREVYLVVNQAGRWITQARWEAVAQAYDRLSMTPGHSVKARSIAAAAGYPPPLAWDDDAIDDGIRFWHPGGTLNSIAIETDVHPGFMTDWQQPLVVALTQTTGLSIVHETVYENRLGFTDALVEAGAHIQTFRECLGGSPCRFGRANYQHSAVISGPTPALW